MSSPNCFLIHVCYRSIVHVSMPDRRHDEILNSAQPETTSFIARVTALMKYEMKESNNEQIPLDIIIDCILKE